eukprot:11290105-Alexandrium_andersonii.AAC.1
MSAASDVYKRQVVYTSLLAKFRPAGLPGAGLPGSGQRPSWRKGGQLSLIHISEPTRLALI